MNLPDLPRHSPALMIHYILLVTDDDTIEPFEPMRNAIAYIIVAVIVNTQFIIQTFQKLLREYFKRSFAMANIGIVPIP